MKKKWVVAAAAFLVAAVAIEASAHGRGWGGKSFQRISLSEQLGLSEDQQAQLEALKTAKMAQKQAVHEEYKAGFEAILTAEQLAALEELKASRRKHRRVPLAEALGLSEDQVAQLRTLGEETMAQKQAVHEEYKAGFEAILTAEQLAALEELKANRRSRFGRHGEKAEDAEPVDGGTATEATFTLQAAEDVATAIEESSWGRIKNAIGD